MTSDWDRQTNFAAYRSFAWLENAQMSMLQANTLFDRRLRSGVERQLTAKGLRKAAETPDVLVAYHAGVENKVDVQQWGYVGRQLDVRQYKEGTLVIDIIDAKRRELVWRGAISGEIEKRGPSDEQLNEALGKVFANFPR